MNTHYQLGVLLLLVFTILSFGDVKREDGDKSPAILTELTEYIKSEIGQSFADDFRNLSMRFPYLGEQRYAGRQLQVMAKRLVNAVLKLPADIKNSSRSIKSVEVSKTPPRSKMLCAQFLDLSPSTLEQFKKNLVSSQRWCDWALIFYRGDQAAVDAYKKNRPSAVVHVGLYKSKSYQQTGQFVPKPLMYLSLLPLLTKDQYDRVWLLDADISLDGFNLGNYVAALSCMNRAGRHVLISQPVVRAEGQVQAYPAFNYDFWDPTEPSNADKATQALINDPEKGKIVASRYRYVEQQVPIFDGHFFLWFLSNVVQPLSVMYEVLQDTDWGLDDIWCKAAAEYGRKVNPEMKDGEGSRCAVIMVTPITHLRIEAMSNSTAISLKHQHSLVGMWRFHFTGYLARIIVKRTFPEWKDFDPDFLSLRRETHTSFLRDENNHVTFGKDCILPSVQSV